MDWLNVRIEEGSSEGALNVVDGMTFDILLLEIGCNLPEITKESVTAHFEQELAIRVEEAKAIFAANLDSIVKQARKERKR